MYKQKNSGFTLVEIAIVLVIVGLLLGGVLKGQEMITNAKIKRVGSDFEGVAAAIFSYQDRYRALPGDDANANSRWGASVDGVNGGNGSITGAFNSTTDTDESRIFWQHLRNSNLIAGETTGAPSFAQPINSFGGIIGVMSGNFGLSGMVVCMTNIDNANAEIIDRQLDDGISNTGSVRGNTTAVDAAAAANYSDAVNTYTLCRKL